LTNSVSRRSSQGSNIDFDLDFDFDFDFDAVWSWENMNNEVVLIAPLVLRFESSIFVELEGIFFLADFLMSLLSLFVSDFFECNQFDRSIHPVAS
jgi:hypothetical protein